MQRQSYWRAVAAFAAALGLVVTGACGDDDDGGGGGGEPAVLISGTAGIVIGGTTQLMAMTVNGSDTDYTWQSDDPATASVSDAGLVTGEAAGETTVRATGVDSGVTGRFQVVVAAPSEQTPIVGITAPSTFVEVGGSVDLTAATTNGTDSSYTWASSDPAVAMVDGTTASVTVNAARTLPDGEFAEVTITATGDQTGASDSVGLVIGIEVPPGIAWAGSGHADRESEAFRHWDEDDPAEVSTRCAKCHSTSGLLDFYGKDGATVGTVDEPVPVANDETVECAACHSETVYTIDAVPFPSGAIVDQFDQFAAVQTCMSCHQGRGSGATVDEDIPEGTDPDAVVGELGFSNIHYYAAAATLFAGQVQSAYQYDGQVYDWRFRHVPQADNCIGCHDPHALTLKTDACSACHTESSPADIRMPTSFLDYDGDGDTTEGIAGEVETLRAQVLPLMQEYAASNPATNDFCFGEGYPYVFNDTNGNGVCDPEEQERANAYSTFTPRLAKAAFNYQAVTVEPGAYAHNAKYVIQFLYDSIIDLNTGITAVGGTPIDTSNFVRNDMGHFNGAGEAARHWDIQEQGEIFDDGEVDASCAQCHAGSEGFVYFINTGMNQAVPDQANGLDCATCHANVGNSDLGELPDQGPWAIRGGRLNEAGDAYVLPFPGIDPPVEDDDATTAMCTTCHSGRETGVTLEEAIAEFEPASDDEVLPALGFVNVHYKAAGATRYGSESGVGAQYAGNTYAGFDPHNPGPGGECASCHNPAENNHSFMVEDIYDAECASCHGDDLGAIRFGSTGDYDGDGSSSEDLFDEIGYLESGEDINDCDADPLPQACGLSDILLLEMQAYAADQGLADICFSPDSYPYFFVDTSGDGNCQPGEAIYPNQYKGNWTPRLLRAAYNYQYSHTEPGAWAHNRAYMTQLLYDSIEDLGGDVTGLTRN